jgi:beta-lactamase regulating signal transducer with metallopeptidase domain
MTQGRTAVVLAVIWITGALAMLVRLIFRLRAERRDLRAPADRYDAISSFMADGIPVSFDSRHPGPAVGGVLYPRILLPIGIDRLLNRQELDAVLLHERARAKRRDNLIRLLHEVPLCALWFHPFIWLAGMRMDSIASSPAVNLSSSGRKDKHRFERSPNLQFPKKRCFSERQPGRIRAIAWRASPGRHNRHTA